MKVYKPDYYDRFRCLASRCPDTCCKDWEVDVDEQTLAYYKTLSGPLGEQIRSCLKENEDGPAISMVEGKCPMCRQDGLCELQVQLGHQALSEVCREFPRIRHEYSGFTELGLELSCPEAARLILTEPYGFTELETAEPEEPEDDPYAMEVLQSTRREALKIAQNEALPIPQMLAHLLLYGYSAQNQLDGGGDAQPDSDLNQLEPILTVPDFHAVAEFFLGLEILTPRWRALLEAPDLSGSWNSVHRAMTRYLIYRYWDQAICDYDLAGRVKFMVLSVLLVKNLGGDPVDTAYLFSREIENDADNVDAILDGCYTQPALTDQNLLSLLLNT